MRLPLPIRSVLATTLVMAASAAAWAQEGDAACLACHGDAAKLAQARSDPARAVEPLLVDAARFAKSVHASRTCEGCHDGYDEHPHGKDAETATCADCHAQEAEVFAESVHGKARAGESLLPVDCAACHGLHDVMKSGSPEDRLAPLNVYPVCGKCHFEKDPATATVDELLHERYTDDTHGHGILKSGLTVSATCVSCHGGHEIHAKGDPKSLLARTRVDETCGKCHVGVVREYRQSVHDVKSTTAEHKGATCTDCHRPHDIAKADPGFLAKTVNTCAHCHEERSGSFRQTYHGKVYRLGERGRPVATCASCHGTHRIVKVDDPESPMHASNRVATCAKCHPGAHERFATYLVHADPTDANSTDPRVSTLNFIYTTMNALVAGTLIVWGIHAGLWLMRALAAGHWRRPKENPAEPWVRRWPTIYVVYHIVLVTCVLLLASTGLPLHYAGQPWAAKLMAFLGGSAAAAWVHRAAAVTLIGFVFVYVGHLAWRVFRNKEKGIFRGPFSMLPRWKDVQDVVANLRWFLFLGPRPQFGRWTYWEKFDFWAVFWGMFVIGASGLMLWFPEQATRFVPGWFLNAALIIHGIEALLDIAFIFTVHAFHANLRPDKFPLDTMFLTGRIPESEFRHDRPEEYEILVREGRLQEAIAPRPPHRLRAWANLIGMCAMGGGSFFVVMMIAALLQS